MESTRRPLRKIKQNGQTSTLTRSSKVHKLKVMTEEGRYHRNAISRQRGVRIRGIEDGPRRSPARLVCPIDNDFIEKQTIAIIKRNEFSGQSIERVRAMNQGYWQTLRKHMPVGSRVRIDGSRLPYPKEGSFVIEQTRDGLMLKEEFKLSHGSTAHNDQRDKSQL